jgi:hypothetical protein
VDDNSVDNSLLRGATDTEACGRFPMPFASDAKLTIEKQYPRWTSTAQAVRGKYDTRAGRRWAHVDGSFRDSNFRSRRDRSTWAG